MERHLHDSVRGGGESVPALLAHVVDPDRKSAFVEGGVVRGPIKGNLLAGDPHVSPQRGYQPRNPGAGTHQHPIEAQRPSRRVHDHPGRTVLDGVDGLLLGDRRPCSAGAAGKRFDRDGRLEPTARGVVHRCRQAVPAELRPAAARLDSREELGLATKLAKRLQALSLESIHAVRTGQEQDAALVQHPHAGLALDLRPTAQRAIDQRSIKLRRTAVFQANRFGHVRAGGLGSRHAAALEELDRVSAKRQFESRSSDRIRRHR